MTNPTPIERFQATTSEIVKLKAERSSIGRDLRLAGIQADEEVQADLSAAVDEAQMTATDLATTLSNAERGKAALDTRIDAGDDSVTAVELTEADIAVRSTKGKQKPADAALRTAKRALDPFLADNHLALLAADTIEGLVDAPVLVRKRASDVQDYADAIVLSQNSPTTGYGTLSVSGEIKVKLVGNATIDWEALEDQLRDAGSEVDVSPQRITFHEAHWPVTRLLAPSQDAVRGYVKDYGRAWHAHISGAEKANRMRQEGYIGVTDNGWTGLFREQGINMTDEGGKVLAEVSFIAAGQHGSDYLSPQEVVANLQQLVEIFRSESVGGVTGAGEIVSITLSDDFKQVANSVWAADGFEWNNGWTPRPSTVECSVEIAFRYEPVEEV